MSPTSYQTAPPRVADLHDSNSAGTDQPARRGRERRESGPWLASSSPADCPATRSSASPPPTTSRSGRADCRRRARSCCARRARRRGAALPAHRPGRRRAARRRPAPARDRQLRGRLRQHRRRGGDGARDPVGNTPGRPHRRDRRPRVRAAARRRAADRRGAAATSATGGWRTWEPQGCSAPTSTARRSPSSAPGASAGRWRSARRGFDMGVAAGRPRRRPARRARARGLRLAPLPAHARDPPPHRRRGARAHEADGDPRQHRARPDRRPGRARRARCTRADSPAPALDVTDPEPLPARPPAARRARTCSSSPTSARPPRPPAPRWPTSRSTTSSPRSTAGRCPTPCTPAA